MFWCSDVPLTGGALSAEHTFQRVTGLCGLCLSGGVVLRLYLGVFVCFISLKKQEVKKTKNKTSWTFLCNFVTFAVLYIKSCLRLSAVAQLFNGESVNEWIINRNVGWRETQVQQELHRYVNNDRYLRFNNRRFCKFWSFLCWWHFNLGFPLLQLQSEDVVREWCNRLDSAEKQSRSRTLWWESPNRGDRRCPCPCPCPRHSPSLLTWTSPASFPFSCTWSERSPSSSSRALKICSRRNFRSLPWAVCIKVNTKQRTYRPYQFLW